MEASSVVCLTFLPLLGIYLSEPLVIGVPGLGLKRVRYAYLGSSFIFHMPDAWGYSQTSNYSVV